MWISIKAGMRSRAPPAKAWRGFHAHHSLASYSKGETNRKSCDQGRDRPFANSPREIASARLTIRQGAGSAAEAGTECAHAAAILSCWIAILAALPMITHRIIVLEAIDVMTGLPLRRRGRRRTAWNRGVGRRGWVRRRERVVKSLIEFVFQVALLLPLLLFLQGSNRR